MNWTIYLLTAAPDYLRCIVLALIAAGLLWGIAS